MAVYTHRRIVLDLISGNDRGLYDTQDIFDKNSFMHPAYRQAITELNGIVKQSVDWSEEMWGDADLYGYGSNIIAFCADRGQGKTSTMLSFGNALRNGLSENEEISPLVANSSFFVMEPIDPSMLMKSGHAVEVVLAFLYKAIKEDLLKGKIQDMCEHDKVKLFADFQRCFRWIQNSNNDELLDEFETYLQIGDGFCVKKTIYDIIQKFLDFKSNDRESCEISNIRKRTRKPNQRYLVIQLDDTDLQLNKTFEIIEEIRKYLSLPNVIVLMAADIGQLRKLVQKHYYLELKQAVEAGICAESDIRRMAAKYIDKFIPSHQIIQLPSLREVLETEGAIRLKKQGSEKIIDLQTYILECIYERTGLIFVKEPNAMHYIIPTTLRGLRQLLQLLEDLEECEALPEVSNSADSVYLVNRLEWTRKREANLAIFKSYFIGDWWASKLSTIDSAEVLTCLTGSSRADTVVYAYYKIAELYNQLNNESCIDKYTFSQFMRVMDNYMKVATDASVKHLCFAVSTFFSMQFTKMLYVAQRHSIEEWLENKLAQRERMFIFDLSILQEIYKDGIFVNESCYNDESLYKSGFCMSVSDIINKDGDDALMLKWLNYYAKALFIPTNQYSKRDPMISVMIQDYAAMLCCNIEVLKKIKDFLTGTYSKIMQGDNYLNTTINSFSAELTPEDSANFTEEINKSNAISWDISKKLNEIVMKMVNKDAGKMVNKSAGKSVSFWGMCNRYFNWYKYSSPIVESDAIKDRNQADALSN